MARSRQVLFVQGGGAGAHDEWDSPLVDNLARQLGHGYEVRYPRMPDEDDPSYTGWSMAIRREITALADGAVVVGHSVGGTILVNALAERPPERQLGMIVLIAAPFVGVGGWPGDEFESPHDLGARLPRGVPVHVFQGLQDQTIPPSHAGLYAGAIPQAQLHWLPGLDHQLGDDLSEVARTIGSDTDDRDSWWPEPAPIRGRALSGWSRTWSRARRRETSGSPPGSGSPSCPEP